MSTDVSLVAAPGFFERISLALRVLLDANLAARVRQSAAAPGAGQLPAALGDGSVTEKVVEKIVEKIVEQPVERVVERVVEKVVETTKIDPEAGALQVLSILQRDGRLVDFLMEDISGASDAEVGAGARVVHQGCKKALAQYVTLEPIKKDPEGAPITVDKGFDANQIRLAGNITGEPPWVGTLAHAGWRATQVSLPERPASIDARVVAPAEIEL
jgi:hypothetical protein